MNEYIIEFKKVQEHDGDLIVLESDTALPFSIKRVFYIMNVPDGKNRADHASKNTDFVLQAIQGKITVEIEDGIQKKCITLDSPNYGLFIPRNTWIRAKDFKEEAILCVYASELYKDCLYFESYKQFLDARGKE